MNITRIDDKFSRSAQIQAADLAAIKDAGFGTVICTRPDNEDPGQPSFAEIEREAARLGLTIVHVPVVGQASPDAVAQFAGAMQAATTPVLGYCRSGTRAENLYRASSAL